MNFVRAFNAFSSLAKGYSTEKIRQKEKQQEEEEREEEREELQRRWEQEFAIRKEQADRAAEEYRYNVSMREQKEKLQDVQLSNATLNNAILDKQLSYMDADRDFQQSLSKLRMQKENLLIQDARSRVAASNLQLEDAQSIDRYGYDAYKYMFGRLAGSSINVPGKLAAETLASAADAAQKFGLPIEWTQKQADALAKALKGEKAKAWKMGSYMDEEGKEVSYVLNELGFKIPGSELPTDKLHPDVMKVYDAVTKEYTQGLNDFITNYSAARGLYSAATGSVINLQQQLSDSADPTKVFNNVSQIYSAQVQQYEKRYGTFREMFDRKMANVLPDQDVRNKVFDTLAPSFARTTPMEVRVNNIGGEVREALDALRKDPNIADDDVRSMLTNAINSSYEGADKVIASDVVTSLLGPEPVYVKGSAAETKAVMEGKYKPWKMPADYEDKVRRAAKRMVWGQEETRKVMAGEHKWEMPPVWERRWQEALNPSPDMLEEAKKRFGK